MSENKMRVLLTGGCGYIGSHTAVELMRAGYDVLIADNFVNSFPAVLPRIEELGGRRPDFRELDFCDAEGVDRHVEVLRYTINNFADTSMLLTGYYIYAVGDSIYQESDMSGLFKRDTTQAAQ